MKTQLSTQINAKKMTLVKDNDIVKIPYLHPNHKNRYSKKWEMSKDNGTNVIKSPNDRSVWNANSPKQINLGWIYSSTYQKLCSTLSSLYRHVLSAVTPQKMMQKHYKALRTKPFEGSGNVTNSNSNNNNNNNNNNKHIYNIFTKRHDS